MKLSPPRKLSEIAKIINAVFEGDGGHLIWGINEIHKVLPGDLVFVDHPKYYEKALNSAATTILINKKTACPPGKALILSKNPFRDYNILTVHFSPFKKAKKAISETSKIGKGTTIQPNVFIGNNVKIGRNCLIHPHVSIYDNCELGDNVIIHSNAIIGADAFYYQKRKGVLNKMHSCGRVIIADNVEIGAGCTIDKGVSGDTVIGQGTKIDNQVQIGHDTVVGKNCLFAAQVGISGAVIIEDEVTLWGQVGIPSGIVIGQGAVVLAQSGVSKSVEGNKIYFGTPASENRVKLRELALIRQLPQLLKNLDK